MGIGGQIGENGDNLFDEGALSFTLSEPHVVISKLTSCGDINSIMFGIFGGRSQILTYHKLKNTVFPLLIVKNFKPFTENTELHNIYKKLGDKFQ